MFHALGVGPDDVVSFLLPLLPQSFCALFGARPRASPIRSIRCSRPPRSPRSCAPPNTKVLVDARARRPGPEIWAKVERIRERTAGAEGDRRRRRRGRRSRGVHSFDALLEAQPADRLLSGRRIAAERHRRATSTPAAPPACRSWCATRTRNEVYQAWADRPDAARAGAILFGLPLFHVGGALTQGLAQLRAGGTIVVLSPAGWRNPERGAQCLAAGAALSAARSSAACRRCWRRAQRAASTTPTSRASAACSGGGSAIPVPIGQAYVERFKVPVLEVYGMTETSSVHTDEPIATGRCAWARSAIRCRTAACASSQLDADGRWRARLRASDEIGVVAMSGPGRVLAAT